MTKNEGGKEWNDSTGSNHLKVEQEEVFVVIDSY